MFKGIIKKRKKISPYIEGTEIVDYTDAKFLSRFISERGKILPSKITGLNPKEQRGVANAVKRARQLGLLAFINYGDSHNA